MATKLPKLIKNTNLAIQDAQISLNRLNIEIYIYMQTHHQRENLQRTQ